jgi:formylglycine-generating enzyme required for sulfatase activity
MDMAGNTLEWTRDWYDGAYYAASPDSNPTGPASGTYKVIRGGSWHHNTLYLRATYRSVKFPNSASNDISFRCVK